MTDTTIIILGLLFFAFLCRKELWRVIRGK